ncbi:MAG: riboflavin kinase [Candidatus Aenigmarchaeota archaeon]|nr:riboflavin kinase [Candidatus Aenigmarchaeota archaeon]
MSSLIALGKMKEFSVRHGHYYSVKGVVEKSDGRGKSIGFPTANIKVVAKEIPFKGVYAVEVKIDDKIYNGVANIGYAPTFNRKEFMAEVHIFDFSADLYGKTIEMFFIDFLREEKKFCSVDELVNQIKRDCESARKALEQSILNAPDGI